LPWTPTATACPTPSRRCSAPIRSTPTATATASPTWSSTWAWTASCGRATRPIRSTPTPTTTVCPTARSSRWAPPRSAPTPPAAGDERAPLDAATDDDGPSAGAERAVAPPPLRADADGDGLSDGLERGRAAPIPAGASAGGVPYAGTGAWTPDADPATTTDPLD